MFASPRPVRPLADTANPRTQAGRLSVGGFDVSVSAIFIGSQETMTERIRGVLAPVVTAETKN
jgi:hypothetical protein